jgi:hypothetical protein
VRLFRVRKLRDIFERILPHHWYPCKGPSLVFSLSCTDSQQWADLVARDDHYKYLILFIIPVGSYFVIANWVGWQYYRNS